MAKRYRFQLWYISSSLCSIIRLHIKNTKQRFCNHRNIELVFSYGFPVIVTYPQFGKGLECIWVECKDCKKILTCHSCFGERIFKDNGKACNTNARAYYVRLIDRMSGHNSSCTA